MLIEHLAQEAQEAQREAEGRAPRPSADEFDHSAVPDSHKRLPFYPDQSRG